LKLTGFLFAPLQSNIIPSQQKKSGEQLAAPRFSSGFRIIWRHSPAVS